MNKKYGAFLLIIVVISTLFLVSCSSGGKTEESALEIKDEEYSKLPENFPIASCPLYAVSEIVSVENNGSESYYSFEVTFNSYYGYDEIIDFYKKRFPDSITKDFGIAYNILVVPNSFSNEMEKYYMLNYNIYSDLKDGEKGICTVVVSVSEY